MISVFISYAREDEVYARQIYDFITKNGYSAWLDKKNLLPGMNWEEEIEKAVKNSDIQVFLLSERSVGKRGVFQKEMSLALRSATLLLEDDISIIPVRLGDCMPPRSLQKYQWVDYESPEFSEQLIATLAMAAGQRGLTKNEDDPQPITTKIISLDETSADQRYEIECSVPQITFPADSRLSQMVSSVVLGNASSEVLDFKRQVSEFCDIDTDQRSYSFQFISEVECSTREFISLRNRIYRDLGGVHGYGYASRLNIWVDGARTFSGHDLIQDHAPIREGIFLEAARSNEAPLVQGDSLEEAIRAALAQNTSISLEGISVEFNQYEVFCYAHGPVSIAISWETLETTGNLTPFGKQVQSSLGGV